MIRRTKELVCPVCNELVPLLPGTNGVVRCGQGHRLEGLLARPAWKEAGIAFLVSSWAATLVTGVGNGLTGNHPGVYAASAVLLSAWSGYLFVRGRGLQKKEEPTRRLAKQYLYSSLGTVFAALLFGSAFALHLL